MTIDASKILRKLAEHQQYSELRDMAEYFWYEMQDPGVLPLQALALAHLGETEAATDLMDRMEEYQKEFDEHSLVDMGAVLIVLRRIDEACNILEQALEISSQHALGIARLGLCHMMTDNPGTAKSLLEEAARLEPQYVPILNNLATVYLELEDYGDAQAIIDRARSTTLRLVDDLPSEVIEQYEISQRSLQYQIWVYTESFGPAEAWLAEQFLILEESVFVEGLIYYSTLLAERDLHQAAMDILREYFQHYTGNIKLCLQLSELAEVQGYSLQSIGIIYRALEQNQDSIELWIQLAKSSMNLNDQQARKAAERAHELAELLEEDDEHSADSIAFTLANTRSVIAQIESQEQHFEQAEKLFNEVLNEYEYFVPALSGLGHQYMQQGRIDEAIILFEKIKDVDPIRGLSSLINARQFPEDIETLEKMEKAAQRPSLEGQMKNGIFFQLAAAWEKRKDYDKAFHFAEQANSASQKFLTYNRVDHRKKCHLIRTGFCRDLYDYRPDCGIDSTLPVYVVGMPRSGTTLVEQIISGHSEIFGAGELSIIPGVIQGLNRWERHVGSGRSYPDCVDDISPYDSESIAKNIVGELQAFSPEAKHIVDKLPHNFENIGLIKFLFPNAKIISVRRDPRDIAISNYFINYQAKHGGMGFAYDLTDIGQQLADHNLLMHHWNEVFPGEILELNYEDIVDDLEGASRTILDYIGVEWEPEVLKFNEIDRPVKTASVWQVRQPIYKTSKAKWERYQEYLAPLIEGTNAQIFAEPIDMITLPEPGFLQKGVEHYNVGDLDQAEMNFKKMLHHNPYHAACTYMLGMVYIHKDYLEEGIKLIEKALETVPWQKAWKENLAKAYELTGDLEKLSALEAKKTTTPPHNSSGDYSTAPGFEALTSNY